MPEAILPNTGSLLCNQCLWHIAVEANIWFTVIAKEAEVDESSFRIVQEILWKKADIKFSVESTLVGDDDGLSGLF